MKTYRNKRLGFEIHVPQEWALPVRVGLGGLKFRCGPDEGFEIAVGPLLSRPSLKATKRRFAQYARDQGYGDLEFGRVSVEGKGHVWIRYRVERRSWAKRYLLVFDRMEYALTAACHSQEMLDQREQVFDAVAKSFRLIEEYPRDLCSILKLIPELTHPSDMSKRVDLCERALVMIVRETDPALWASLQNQLANSLLQNPIGDRAHNLERAIRHNEQALEVFTRQAYPREWAGTHGDLASVYRHRMRGVPAKNIERAIGHFHQALEVFTREDCPEEWAATHNNLANAYRDRISGDRAENIEQTIRHCQQALEVFSRQAYPWHWATAQHNLANAYQDRIRGEKVENLERAIRHYSQALDVFTRDAYPEDWAWTHSNLGTVYHTRIRGEKAENIEVAILHCQQALEVFTRQAFPEKWGLAHYTLGNTFRDRLRGGPSENIEQAIHHYQLAREVLTLQTHPTFWAAIDYSLEKIAGPDRGGKDLLKDPEYVVQLLLQVLRMHDRQSHPKEWGCAQNDLGEAYRRRTCGDRAENIERAISHYQQALQVSTRQTYPELWAATQYALALAYPGRSRGGQSENVEQAISHAQQALEVFTRDAYPEQSAGIHEFLALIQEYKDGVLEVKSRGIPPLTYPQYYQKESRRQPGEERRLKLIGSMIPDFGTVTQLILVYQWEDVLPDEEARRLCNRAIMYIACAIYDAATAVGLFCQASPIPNGRRPAWYIRGEKVPVSLTLSDIDISDRTCYMTIGAMLVSLDGTPSSRTHWEKLQAGFSARFREICV